MWMVAAVAVAAPVAAQAPACADSVAAFRRVVAEFQSRQRNVAISVGVQHRGQVVFREATGMADAERGVKADAEMAFSIASITKPFTGAALLTLVEQGTIDLDAPVQRWIPELPAHPSGRPVTVRMLAHHLGALRHWGAERDSALLRHVAHAADMLPLFVRDPWVSDVVPGAKYSYSSYGYNALAVIIERASGVPFREYVQRTVLTPLALRTVQFDRPGLGGARRPARYSWYDLKDFHELDTAPQRVPEWDYSHNMGGGGLVASVGDLLTFGRAMRGPGVLRAASIERLWTRPRVGDVESPVSFGWSVRANPARLAASGSNAGVQAGLVVWRDADLVVAVLANSWGRGSRSGELMSDAADGLIGRLAAVCGG